VRIAEAADHPFSRVVMYSDVGYWSLRQGDLHRAIPLLERALDLAQVAHLRVLVPPAASSLGVAYALTGRTADALPLLEQAVEQAVAMRHMRNHALWADGLGAAYLLAGRLAEVGAQAQRALDFAQARRERHYEAYALRLLGEVAAHRDPLEGEQAAIHYRQRVPYDIYAELDLGPGGYATAPSTDIRHGVREAIKRKLGR
jgi:tetratricopeptide (TPR) repeat protein